MIARIVSNLFYLYFLLIIIRIFLSWIHDIDWNSQPFRFLVAVCDPYLNIFRGIIPPIGGVLDISPVLAIILLQLLQGLIVNWLFKLGI